MTVSELVDKLWLLPGDMEVVISNNYFDEDMPETKIFTPVDDRDAFGYEHADLICLKDGLVVDDVANTLVLYPARV